MKISHTVRLVLLALVAMPLVLSSNPAQAQEQTAKTETRNTTRWIWNEDEWSRRVEIHGKAQFAEDYSDVSSLSEDGYVAVEEVRNGKSQRLEVRRDAGGRLVRKYFVNGESRTLDDNGRKWAAELLLTAVRQGSIDVEGRVKSLVKKRGVNGTLQEITSIEGDHGKRIYFQALLKTENLSQSDLQKTLDMAGAQITSDYERANILKSTADVFMADPSLRTAFFRNLAGIRSDYEHRRVLSALLKRKNPELLSHLLEAASSINSDYEKATFLLEASRLYTGETRLRSVFLKAVETIKSDHERGRVLSAMVKNGQIG